MSKSGHPARADKPQKHTYYISEDSVERVKTMMIQKGPSKTEYQGRFIEWLINEEWERRSDARKAKRTKVALV